MYKARPVGDSPESSFFKLPDTLLLAFDESCKLHLISDAWAATLGFSPEDLHAMSFLELLHENDRAECADKLASLRLDGISLRFSGRCRRSDGSYLGVAWSVTYQAEEGLYYAAAHETAVNLSGNNASLPDMYVDGLTGLPNRSLFLDRL